MSYLLRLSACLFLSVSLNSFGAIIFVTPTSNYGSIKKFDATTGDYLGEINGPYGNSAASGEGSIAYAPSPVPLPAGIYLFLSGLVGLGLMRSRNNLVCISRRIF